MNRVRLSVAQVAVRLNVSPSKARRLMVSGPLDSIRVGRRLVAEWGAVERYRQGRAA